MTRKELGIRFFITSTFTLCHFFMPRLISHFRKSEDAAGTLGIGWKESDCAHCSEIKIFNWVRV